MFCKSYTAYSRRRTNNVEIGNLSVGSDFPVRIQSMTNTDTLDTAGTVAQCIRMIRSGAEYVRITAPTIKDAENLKTIREMLRNQGYETPLIADIHFSPKAAETAAEVVAKIRINPGNYSETKRLSDINYTDIEYQSEIKKIKDKLIPLLDICKKNKTALRIGTNHGSLSDRIMSRYGDTPLGMVESTLEFIRICVSEKFYNIVVSMKAGNPKVMIQACRLFVEKSAEENLNFPLHLGVTEAGDGEDGRVKSAVGIGSLSADGIGDTIRVSLTEDPESELPVAKLLTEIFAPEKLSKYKPSGTVKFEYDFLNFTKRNSFSVANIGGENPPVVISNYFGNDSESEKYKIINSDFLADRQTEKNSTVSDYTYDKTLSKIQFKRQYQIRSFPDYLSDRNPGKIQFVKLTEKESFLPETELLKEDKNAIIIAEINNEYSTVHNARSLFFRLGELQIENPVVIHYKTETFSEAALLQAAGEIGAIMIDGFGDGIWIDSPDKKHFGEIQSLSFSILQACRLRMSKTEYISCPSCGRTLFDLQGTVARIKAKTNHLKNLKIGIMGCIVNGPGEMADADYGYVGTGKGKITLYKKKEIIKKNISESMAVEELINIIKTNGDWTEQDSVKI
jgi:(E)-4-hydroxy-3-methylbut-2-enyl-diphosphate synthase